MTPPQFERLKGEKAEQWQAFKIYRDMGSTRSMQELARIMKRPVRTMYLWSNKFNWLERIKSYEEWSTNDQVKERAEAMATDMVSGLSKAVNAVGFVLMSDLKYKQQQWKAYWRDMDEKGESKIKPPAGSTNSLLDSMVKWATCMEKIKEFTSTDNIDEFGAIDELVEILKNEPETTEATG